MDNTSVPLNDLGRQYQALKLVLEDTVRRVLRSGWYILGPEVEAFEHEFAQYCQTDHCVGLANGTDALEIGLRALGIAAGDHIITVANAGMYGTTAIRAIGAIPVFAEIDPHTLTMDPDALDAAITPHTRALIVTHLYGRAADLVRVKACAYKHGIALIEDCAQAHGAIVDGRRVGSWGDVGCFSFYPTKNLGALGDGGAIVTSNVDVAERARRLRQYGWVHKYDSRVSGGCNSRLDEIQAAILRAKLPYLDGWNQARRQIADHYQAALVSEPLELPALSRIGEMIYHLYVVRTSKRDGLRKALVEQGIGCDVHYPIPDHLQESCADLGYSRGALPETERASAEVLTLPCFAELSPSEIDRVIAVVKASLRALK
ncbi:MAG: DegT/DnrJ/EryC1/StrS family aminotransferase [Anaerolineae bacterium]|nr:DegT/DnrJ/EryC1/StrS family aminotransferase [Anaerolineae bacterium]